MLDLDWETKNMTASQIKIANYIHKHTQQVLLSTEKEIAAAIKVSIATVSRFWSVVGYSNLKDFKKVMRDSLEASPASKIKHELRNNKSESINFVKLEKILAQLHQTMEHLHAHTFKKAAAKITTARRIFILAPGPSEGLGRLLTYRLNRYGLTIHFIEKLGTEMFEDLAHIKKEDLVILFSFGRLLPEAKVILLHQRKKHFHSLLISDQLVADFTKEASMTLFASRGERNEFHSMIAPTYLIEQLILAVGNEKKEANLLKLEELSNLRKTYASYLPR